MLITAEERFTEHEENRAVADGSTTTLFNKRHGLNLVNAVHPALGNIADTRRYTRH